MTPLWIALCFVTSAAAVNSSFRFGLAYSSVEPFKLHEIKEGYELFFNEVNSRFGDEGFFLIGKANESGHRFHFDFVSYDSKGNKTLHKQHVKALLKEDEVHFLGGSDPEVAKTEMRRSNKAGVLNYHCCVGPDHLYQLNYSRVFGVQASNTEYTKTLIRALELEGARRMAFVYDENDTFAKTTCKAGIQFHKDSAKARDNTITIEQRLPGNRIEFDAMAAEMKRQEVEVVIACVRRREKALIEAFHRAQYSLKAFFITVGPNEDEWLGRFNKSRRHVDNLLSAAQWHSKMNLTGDFFGKAESYAALYREKTGSVPLYTAAGASAVGLTLWYAIRDAFQTCDISKTNGDVDLLLNDAQAIDCSRSSGEKGKERIVKALAKMDRKTFFGRVKFNEFRRNVGLTPVTTQVFENESANDDDSEPDWTIDPVLPVGFAESKLQYAKKNYYPEACSPGQFIGQNAFDRCQQCPEGQQSNIINATRCESCLPGEYADGKGKAQCTKCPSGTTTEVKGATSIENCTCAAGYYHLDYAPGEACKRCPEGAICDGGEEEIELDFGYWGMALSNEYVVYECDPQSNCPGGTVDNCTHAHTGRLCASCEKGYFKVNSRCYRCWNKASIVLAAFALLLGWYLINVIVSKSMPSLEMMLSWAQLANIIGDIDLNWTSMVTTMFSVANILDFDVDILEPSCLVTWGFTQNFIIQLCLPLAMTIMGWTGSTVAYALYSRGQRDRKSTSRVTKFLSYFISVPDDKEASEVNRDKTLAKFLASIDVTYVTITKYCFDVFKCRDMAVDTVLNAEPDFVCHTREHNFLKFLASLGIAIYVIGYPLFVCWKLYSLRLNGKFGNFSDAVQLRRFGFIYKKYELDYNFTPAIVILRKLCFVLVLVYMNNPAFQIGAIAIIINASLMIHVYTAPYVDTYLDVLFSFLLLALMFEAFGGLMFYSENLPQANREILEWIIMVSLFMLIIVFLVILVKEMTAKYWARFVEISYRRRMQFQLKSEEDARENGLERLHGFCDKGRENTRFMIQTFDPNVVSQAICHDPEFIVQWDELNSLLGKYVSKQSDVSYLSTECRASFWRRLVKSFPELVDFLAVADEDTHRSFRSVVTNLYCHFYLVEKMTRLPLTGIINWKDRAPMAQWLSIATEHERGIFCHNVNCMLRSAGNIEAADIFQTKIKTGGEDPKLNQRTLFRTQLRRNEIIGMVFNRDSPFHHSERNRYAPSDSLRSQARPIENTGDLTTTDPGTSAQHGFTSSRNEAVHDNLNQEAKSSDPQQSFSADPASQGSRCLFIGPYSLRLDNEQQ